MKIFFLIIAAFGIMITAVSCKNSGNAPSTAAVEGLYQLAYGASLSDREQLANRIAGNTPPKFAEVISKWKRFSGTTYYPLASAIVANPSYCQTSMDGNGTWANSVSPVVNPNTAAACNTESMNSLSWVYLTSPDRLFNIQNTTFYNGFFSSLKFDNYIAEATLSSAGTDDDAMGVSIAVVVDESNNVHTLSAYRTQGGFPDPTLGWGLIHKVNGVVSRVIDNKSVGGTNKNGGGGGGDSLGWNGRNTQIRIERTGNIIKAYTSLWNTGATALPIELTSLIQVDVSDPLENLTIFMGAQSYGYETISQAQATFSNLSFITPLAVADPEYLFDLRDNLVYTKKTTGIGYELVVGLKALDMLGYPKSIVNIETQTEFTINSSTSYTEL